MLPRVQSPGDGGDTARGGKGAIIPRRQPHALVHSVLLLALVVHQLHDEQRPPGHPLLRRLQSPGVDRDPDGGRRMIMKWEDAPALTDNMIAYLKALRWSSRSTGCKES